MREAAVNRVRRRRKELSDEIAKLEEERDRLDAYLLVQEEFSRPAVRTVSGKEIDALCQMVLRDARDPHDARAACGCPQGAVRCGD